MKNRFIIAALLFSAFILVGCEQGSYFDSDTKQIQSDKVSRLETVGVDLRIYEFTPQTAPHMQCVFVAGDKKGGLYCFPKK